MKCCDTPDIKSSTYSDYCTNCGWYYSYLKEEEGYDYSNIERYEEQCSE